MKRKVAVGAPGCPPNFHRVENAFTNVYFCGCEVRCERRNTIINPGQTDHAYDPSREIDNRILEIISCAKHVKEYTEAGKFEKIKFFNPLHAMLGGDDAVIDYCKKLRV